MTNLGPQKRHSRHGAFTCSVSPRVASSAVTIAATWKSSVVIVRRLSRYLSCFLVAWAPLGGLRWSDTVSGWSSSAGLPLAAASSLRRAAAGPYPTFLSNTDLGGLIEAESTIGPSLLQSNFIVANSTVATVAGESGSVVSAGLAINGSWGGLQGIKVVATDASANHVAGIGADLSSVGLVRMSVSLAVTHVIGENVELVVEHGHVVDVRVVVGLDTVGVDTLEPVDSHGGENITDVLALNSGAVKSSDDELVLSVESLLSVLKVVLNTADGKTGGSVGVGEISEVVIGEGDSLVLSLKHILNLTVEEVELQVEWSLDLEEVVVVDLGKTVDSLVEDEADEVLSAFVHEHGQGLESIDLDTREGVESSDSSSEIWGIVSSTGNWGGWNSTGVATSGAVGVPVIVALWLDGVITHDVVSSLVSSVSDAGSGFNVTWDELVSEGVSVTVGVAVAVSNTVAVAELAAEGRVVIAHVRGDLSQGKWSKN